MDDKVKDLDVVTALALDALSASIKTSFMGMTGLPAEIAAGDTAPEPGFVVAGLIGLTGDWKGMGVLECCPALACEMSNLMLGVEDSRLKDDGMNAVAEMSNIIFGTMKTDIEDLLGYMGMSTPTVICGTDLQMYNAGAEMTTIPVRVGEYAFQVKLVITRAEETRKVGA